MALPAAALAVHARCAAAHALLAVHHLRTLYLSPSTFPLLRLVFARCGGYRDCAPEGRYAVPGVHQQSREIGPKSQTDDGSDSDGGTGLLDLALSDGDLYVSDGDQFT